MTEPKHDISIRGDLLKALTYMSTVLEKDKSDTVAKALSTFDLLIRKSIKGHKVVLIAPDGSMEQVVIL